ncbi:hypothetical protein AVEN_89795-1 [Araneus ventricosus]|uniref:Cadherin domain-containing protein n=1 Tax=Araneus ventricosus TaxID=182803 RepID=A0A4Y2I3C5_ARAVE|nr:hypothetical protein AVEN_89795-1 [Araneus ventricosus]
MFRSIPFLLMALFTTAAGVAPTIDLSHNMRILKLPMDTKPGSLIYRLRGSDPDNDILTFGVRGDVGSQLLSIQSVTETRANVFLKVAPTVSIVVIINPAAGNRPDKVYSSITPSRCIERWDMPIYTGCFNNLDEMKGQFRHMIRIQNRIGTWERKRHPEPLENAVASHTYKGIKRSARNSDAVPVSVCCRVCFQHDGDPAHFSRQVRRHL